MKTAKNTTCAIALAIAATLAACSAEGEPMGEQPQPIDPTISVPLKITAALQSSVTASATRAKPTPVPLKEGSIGVFLRRGNDAERENVKYTGKDGVWNTATPSDAVCLGGYASNVTAYYPYNTNDINLVATGNDMYFYYTGIKIATQDYDETKLYYCTVDASVNGSMNNGAICFTLGHVYVRVRLHITYTGSSDWKITSLGLYNEKLALKATRSVFTRYYRYTEQGNYDIKNLPSAPLTVDTYTRDLLLITPSLYDTPVIVKMTINGQKLKAEIPANWDPREGQLYDINITVRGTEVLPVTVTTTDWEVVNVPGGSYLPIP